MSADSIGNENEQQSFEKLVSQAPTIDELVEPKAVTFIGIVVRSAKAGMFMLLTQDLGVIELPINAVQRCETIGERSRQPLVEVEVSANYTAPFVPAIPHHAPKIELEKQYFSLLGMTAGTIKEGSDNGENTGTSVNDIPMELKMLQAAIANHQINQKPVVESRKEGIDEYNLAMRPVLTHPNLF